MRELMILTKVLLKTSMQQITDGKSKKWSTSLLYLFLVICFIPVIYGLYEMFNHLFAGLVLIGQEGAGIAAGLYISSLVTFFFSLFMIPGVYYFSKDIQTLLYLPIRPYLILASKFIVMLLYEYLFTLMVLGPMYVSYVHMLGVSASAVVMGLIAFLLLPVVPLLYSSLITLVLMRFVPFAKNKDRFNMIFGTIGILVTLFVVYYLQFYSVDALVEDENFLISMLLGNDSILNIFASIFPTVPMITKAFIYGDLVQLGLFIGIVIVLILLFLGLGHKLYLKTAVNISDSSADHKKISTTELGKYTKKQALWFSYFQKEVRLLVRNPVYFQNCVLISFIMPVVIYVPMLIGLSEDGAQYDELLADLQKAISILFDTYTSEAYAFVVLIGLGIGFFMSNSNMISATAISREGTNYQFMKYIPVPYLTQLFAKLLSGVLFSLLGGLLVIVPVLCLIKLPVLASILLLFTYVLGVFYGNCFGLLVDLLHPKLVWEQEASAVKQNFTAAIMMLSGFALCGILVFVGIEIGMDHIILFAYGLLALLVLTLPVLKKLIEKQANRLFARL